MPTDTPESAAIRVVVAASALYAASLVPATGFRLRMAGLMHTAADGLKMIFKEDFVPKNGDRLLHSIAPMFGLFPPLVVRMIRVGEGTGGLDKSLLKISYFYDRDVNESIEKMMKLIEPTLTVILGGILAFIMFSVLGPVYDSFDKLNI